MQPADVDDGFWKTEQNFDVSGDRGCVCRGSGTQPSGGPLSVIEMSLVHNLGIPSAIPKANRA